MICCCFSFALILIAFFVYREETPEEVNEGDAEFKTKMKKIFKVVANPKIRVLMIVVLLLIATPSLNSVFNYFLTEELHFTADFMGTISFISSLAYLIGVIMSNTVFSGADFKQFYASTTMFAVLMNSASLILVFRLNLKLGISDKYFSLSNSAITTFLYEINMMPVLAFISRLCPKGLEGSTYAVFTALFNFAYYMSSFSGSTLIWAFNVSKHNFSNLWILIVIQVIYSLVIAIFLCINGFPKLEGDLSVKGTESEVSSSRRISLETLKGEEEEDGSISNDDKELESAFELQTINKEDE